MSGAAVHDEHTDAVTHIDGNQGGDLLTNQLLTEGHRATVDWGKVDYRPARRARSSASPTSPPPRNEFDARFQAHEDYEPAIPDVTVYLEGPGQDGQPSDDVILNKYVTDHWQHPNASQDPPQGCAVTDSSGADISGQMNPDIGPNCLEMPITGEQTKDGAFDGGYAFANYCPDGMDTATGLCADGSDPGDHPLVAGT